MTSEENKVKFIHYSLNKYVLSIYYCLELDYSNKQADELFVLLEEFIVLGEDRCGLNNYEVWEVF